MSFKKIKIFGQLKFTTLQHFKAVTSAVPYWTWRRLGQKCCVRDALSQKFRYFFSFFDFFWELHCGNFFEGKTRLHSCAKSRLLISITQNALFGCSKGAFFLMGSSEFVLMARPRMDNFEKDSHKQLTLTDIDHLHFKREREKNVSTHQCQLNWHGISGDKAKNRRTHTTRVSSSRQVEREKVLFFQWISANSRKKNYTHILNYCFCHLRTTHKIPSHVRFMQIRLFLRAFFYEI